ncbi:MAG: hypothetical protein UHN47_05780 [Lachnospiraceae bacterium]|nr:hypothetical protein [Lachnospiraceae bacterium]
MERNVAAVLQKYDTTENEFFVMLEKSKEIEFKALECETPAGVIKLNKKEVERIFMENTKKKYSQEERQNKILEVIRKSGDMIRYIEEPDEEMQIMAVANSPYCIKHIKNPTKDTKTAYLLNKRYDAPQMGYCRRDEEEFIDFSPEEIASIVYEKPAAMSGVPKEMITEDIVYHFLKGLVEQNLPYLEGGFSNIPEEHKNKFYWQCMCMVNGYNFSRIPQGKREEYVSEKLIRYCLEHSGSYIGTLWMYQYIPEKFKTKEISILSIIHHFGCIQHLPEELKTKDFLRELAEADKTLKMENNYTWFQDIDMKMIDKEFFREMVLKYHITRIPEKVPSSYYDEETAIILAQNHANQIPKAVQTEHYYDVMAELGYIGRIPEEKLNEERCLKLVQSKKYGVLSKIPEKFKTDSFMETVIREELYLNLEDIIDHVTVDIVKQSIKERRITNFKEIPVSFRSCEMVDLLADHGNGCREIPYEYQTEKSCQQLLSKCDKNRHEWFYHLERCRYKTEDDIEYAIEHYKQAINLPEITREQIDRSVAKYPQNILHVPEWYLKQERKEEKVGEKTTQKQDVKKVVIQENTTFTQLDLFGLLGI